MFSRIKVLYGIYSQEERGIIKSQTVGANGSFINNGWHYLDH